MLELIVDHHAADLAHDAVDPPRDLFEHLTLTSGAARHGSGWADQNYRVALRSIDDAPQGCFIAAEITYGWCMEFKKLFSGRPIELRWEDKVGTWLLLASIPQSASISVEKRDWYWEVMIGNCPLNHRYTSEIGAKNDAWEYAKKNCRELFGAYRVELVR